VAATGFTQLKCHTLYYYFTPETALFQMVYFYKNPVFPSALANNLFLNSLILAAYLLVKITPTTL